MTDFLEPQGPDETGTRERRPGRQLLWFAGIALASVMVVAATAYVLRALLFVGS